MKGLFLTNYGFNFKKRLKFLERELPPLGPNDVLITVRSAGLNPVDYKIVYGMALIIMNPPRPFALGFDLAGIVSETGSNVKTLNIGDEVYAKVPWEQMGTIATHIHVNEGMVSLKPKNISFTEAAGIPLVGCTVFDAFEVAELKKDDTILIIGGSGGVGTFAIQYAKFLGAKVTAITSTKNIELVKSLGADMVIDYKQEDFRKLVKDISIVFDTVGGTYPWRSIKVVKKGGKIISIAGHHDDTTLNKVGVTKFFRVLFQIKGYPLLSKMKRKEIFYKHVWSYPKKETLDYIRSLIESGDIKPINNRDFPFEQSIEALNYLRTNRAKGKVTITIEKAD